MCSREERRESLKRTPTISIFKFPVSIFRLPQAPHSGGWEGGGPSTVTDLCRGWGGQNFQLKIISQLINPLPLHVCVGEDGGGLILAAAGRPQQSDGSFFSNLPTAQGNNANKYLICT